MRVFAYLRVSGKGQIDGDGFDRQRAAIERFCVAKGWTVARWFEEPAVSGTTEHDERPAFAEMLATMAPATTEVFVVECADRLARDLVVSELLIAEVKKRGFQVWSAAGELNLTNSDDPTRVLIRQLMGALAQWDKSNIVRKLRAARDRKSKEAGRRVEGPKPYEIRHKEHAMIAASIVLMHEQGVCFREIADRLNVAGFPGPSGKKSLWAKSTVHSVYVRHSKNLRAVDPIRPNPKMAGELGFVLPEPTVS